MWKPLMRIILVSVAALFLGLGIQAGLEAEDGSCSYDPGLGCVSTDCGHPLDPNHECVVHDEPPPTHCDCVPKAL